MSDMDADALRLRNWQATVEARLTALESRLGGTVVSSGLSPADQEVITDLRATIAGVEAKVEDLTTKVTDTSGVLAGVEAALGSHSHPG